MEWVFNAFVVLHFVGLSLLLGAFLVQLTSSQKTVTRWMFDGAMTQLVTGIVMVGLLSSKAYVPFEGFEVDIAKITTKLVIAVVIGVLAFVGKRRPAPQVGLWLTIGLLTLANVVIAVVW